MILSTFMRLRGSGANTDSDLFEWKFYSVLAEETSNMKDLRRLVHVELKPVVVIFQMREWISLVWDTGRILEPCPLISRS